jgi:NADPH-dependent 7-cyano-7-deazaguanine reductase QueF
VRSRDYVTQIEEMDDAALKKRIVEAMDHEIEAKIRPIPYVGGEKEIVEYRYPEMTAKCPMTGLRDFYELVIRFEPDQLIPELKSLKQYFCGYDSLPISHEHLAAKVYRDIRKAVKPLRLSLKLDTAVRGGIKTIVYLGDDF